jgi:hypothetical protein
VRIGYRFSSSPNVYHPSNGHQNVFHTVGFIDSGLVLEIMRHEKPTLLNCKTAAAAGF